jgi:hypothetical protein
LQLGNAIAETGADAGSNFALLRFNDAGAGIDTPFTMERSTGRATFTQTLFIPSGFYSPANWPLRFEWDGLAVLRSVNNGTFYSMYDLVNSPSGGAGSGAYQKFITGQILQFGSDAGGGEKTITFPVAFPNVCQTVVVTMIAGSIPSTTLVVAHIDGIGPSGFTVRPRYFTGAAGGVATQGFAWYAVGY